METNTYDFYKEAARIINEGKTLGAEIKRTPVLHGRPVLVLARRYDGPDPKRVYALINAYNERVYAEQ